MVGSTTSTGFEASYSNHGDDVDIAAPGSDIVMPDFNPYNIVHFSVVSSGTSFSSPMVAAAVAAMRAIGGANFSNPVQLRLAVIGTATLGRSQNIGRFLGYGLSGTPVSEFDTSNTNQVAAIRELNLYNAIALAKSGSGSLVARPFNTDDVIWAAKNRDWVNRFTTENYLWDSIWDLSSDGYVSGDRVTFATNNSASGPYGQRASGYQVYRDGWLTWERIRGVATREAPWGVLYSTRGATNDTSVGWFDEDRYLLP